MSNKNPNEGCTLSDQKLIDSCREWISKLCDSGGKEWTLGVPVDFNRDPDMLFSEVITRFKSTTEENEELRVKTRFLGELIDSDIAARTASKSQETKGPQVIEKEEFFKIIDEHPWTACAAKIWDALQTNNCQVIKKGAERSVTLSKGHGNLKWVKASEQMPPTAYDKKRLHIKFEGEPRLLIYLNGIWCWLDDTDFNSSDYPVFENSWSDIEWLDESCQADSVPDNLQEAMKLIDQMVSRFEQAAKGYIKGEFLIAKGKEVMKKWESSIQAYKEKGEQ
jgi:hypothetical protein